MAGIGHRCWDGLDGIGQRRKGDLSVPQNAGTLFMLRLCRVRLRVGLGLRLLLVRLDYCQRHTSLRSDWWVWLHGWCLLRRTVGLLEHSVRLQCWCCISLNTRRRGNWLVALLVQLLAARLVLEQRLGQLLAAQLLDQLEHLAQGHLGHQLVAAAGSASGCKAGAGAAFGSAGGCTAVGSA